MDLAAEIGMSLWWLGMIGLIFCGIGLIWKGVCRLVARLRPRRRRPTGMLRDGGALITARDIRGRTVVVKYR